MFRSSCPALCAALVLLAGCGSGAQPAADAPAANTAVAAGNEEIEALPSDGLAAPEGMALDSESVTESNAVGSASGGNAM